MRSIWRTLVSASYNYASLTAALCEPMPMKVIVQIAAADDAKAWALLIRHSPGVALPNRTFILSPDAV